MPWTLADLAEKSVIEVTSRVGIVRCEPVWEFKPYRLVDFLIWCVLDGVGNASVFGRPMTLSPGTCLVLPPGAALSATHDPARRLRVFYLHAEFYDARRRRLDEKTVAGPPIPTVVNDLTLFEPLARQVVAGNSARTPEGRLRRDLALRLLLLKIQESTAAPVTRSDAAKLTTALMAVRENPGTHWTVPAIARAAGLSVSQAARRIRELTGHNPRGFVIRARIERARRLMVESSMTLDQIASSLGYADVYFFHRQFKAVSGMTPGEFRRQSSRPASA